MTTATPTFHKKTEESHTDSSSDGWKTVLLNCNCHTFDSVISQLMDAIACSYAQARRYAYIVHSTGQATVFTGSEDQCERVADKLAEIGLRARVSQ